MHRHIARIPRSAAAIAVATAALILACLTSPSTASADSTAPQAEIDQILATTTGGVQVSDNAIMWDGGNVVVVVPNQGELVAPAGLGSNVRTGLLTTPTAKALAADSGVQPADTHGCPGGYLTKDYYCFYQYKNFGGRRVQFSGDTPKANAKDFGFNNTTSSWVSNDVDCTVHTYDYANQGGENLWNEPEDTISTYVGDHNNNRMSSWTCR